MLFAYLPVMLNLFQYLKRIAIAIVQTKRITLSFWQIWFAAALRRQQPALDWPPFTGHVRLY